jgi:hypothetical protein
MAVIVRNNNINVLVTVGFLLIIVGLILLNSGSELKGMIILALGVGALRLNTVIGFQINQLFFGSSENKKMVNDLFNKI